MYKELQNYEASLLVMHSEERLRTAMTFVVQTTHTYTLRLLRNSLYPNDWTKWSKVLKTVQRKRIWTCWSSMCNLEHTTSRFLLT